MFKGKRQLHWSRGLKKLYAIGERTDEQLATDAEDDFSVLLGTLTVDQWRDVLAVDGRGPLLSIAASSGWPAVLHYLEHIAGSGAARPVVIDG